MSLQTALHRARYRHLEALYDIAKRHYSRSGIKAYLVRSFHLDDELMDLYPLCNFPVSA